MSNSPIIPLILCGGSGTRLWPLSRESYPKQYLSVERQSKYSLIQKTYLRLKGLAQIIDPIFICNEDHRFIVAEQMNEIGLKSMSIILEPVRRGTAPSIAIAALMSLKEDYDPLLLVLSSDHLINNEIEFINAINRGILFAQKGRIVTFGVIPTRPEIGYGYIESTDTLTSKRKSSGFKRFIEKPNKEMAESLIKDRHFTWNSGIFLFKASVIVKELTNFEPDIINLCSKSIKGSTRDFNFERIQKDYFEKCSHISIDVAVMEKTKLGTVISLDAGWSDVGDWQSVWKNSKKDSMGNCLVGNSILKNSQNCYLRSEKRLVVGLDINNLIIVETDDAILIANKNSAQDVKLVVEDLYKNNIVESKLHKKIYRPWGNFISIEDGPTWQVKRLEIKPKASLSLQLHKFRSEHWVVVSGKAKVEIDQKITILNANQSIYVPLGSKHRLSNPSEDTLIIIEVQSGSYLGEDDILRFNDIYGR